MNKILHICESLRLGGEEKFLLDIYPALNHDFNHIIVPLVHCGELYAVLKNAKLESYKSHRFVVFLYNLRNFLSIFIKPFLFIYLFWRIAKILKQDCPDGIVVYEPKINILIYLALKVFRFKKNFKWYLRIGSQIFDENIPLIPKKISLPLIIKIFKNIFECADCLIVVSTFLARELTKYYGFNKDKILVLPVCLPSDDNEGKDNGDHYLHQNELYFVYAGRLETVKGVDILIHAFSQLIKITNKIHYKLIIFGDGSKQKKIEKLIKRLDLGGHVKMLGYVKNPIIESDKIVAYILPSRSEGFGKVLIEAMHKRNIVISSNCTGPLEIIDEGEHGFLFENGDYGSLFEKMLHVTALSEEDKNTIVCKAYFKSLEYEPNNIARIFDTKLKKDFTVEKSIFNH